MERSRRPLTSPRPVSVEAEDAIKTLQEELKELTEEMEEKTKRVDEVKKTTNRAAKVLDQAIKEIATHVSFLRHRGCRRMLRDDNGGRTTRLRRSGWRGLRYIGSGGSTRSRFPSSPGT